MSKPSIPKGTRDFLPAEVLKRQHVFHVIKEVYTMFGYQPIETPSMELLSTLTGKYGEEGDKLLFKVLNNGDFLSKANPSALEERNSSKLTSSIAKRGMRYDLTVPFARFVVMNQNEISFPFKRYQIQPVWRADRPQKGRYQEFYQCDADVVGSTSLMYEAEIIQMLNRVFSELGIEVIIRINNRKILNGIAEVAGIADAFMVMTIAIDKLDKIGHDKVVIEMENGGIPEQNARQALSLISEKNLDKLGTLLESSEIGMKGINEVKQVFNLLNEKDLLNVEIDTTLARGLNYYTGCIFEVIVDTTAHPDVVMGSIAGGGRYDDLTSTFGLKDVSGVGISFGAARIYDVLNELEKYPENVHSDLDILLVSFDDASFNYGFSLLSMLRSKGIKADIYPSPVKMKKQMKYANQRGTKYVGVIGETEVEAESIMLKNMATGDQGLVSVTEIESKISE